MLWTAVVLDHIRVLMVSTDGQRLPDPKVSLRKNVKYILTLEKKHFETKTNVIKYRWHCKKCLLIITSCTFCDVIDLFNFEHRMKFMTFCRIPKYSIAEWHWLDLRGNVDQSHSVLQAQRESLKNTSDSSRCHPPQLNDVKRSAVSQLALWNMCAGRERPEAG